MNYNNAFANTIALATCRIRQGKGYKFLATFNHSYIHLEGQT